MDGGFGGFTVAVSREGRGSPQGLGSDSVPPLCCFLGCCEVAPLRNPCTHSPRSIHPLGNAKTNMLQQPVNILSSHPPSYPRTAGR